MHPDFLDQPVSLVLMPRQELLEKLFGANAEADGMTIQAWVDQVERHILWERHRRQRTGG